jgi:hypothetical protein
MHIPRLRPLSVFSLRQISALLASLLLMSQHAFAAEPPVKIENVRVGFNDAYKLGTWTPISVDLKAGRQAFSGYLEAVVADDDGTSTYKQIPVAIEPSGFATFHTFVRPGAQNGDMVVRVLDERGRRVTYDVDVTERNGKTINSLEPSQVLLLTVGNPRGVDEIAALSGFTSGSAGGGQTSDLMVTNVKPQEMPGTWYGYDAANVIVLDSADAATMSQLDRFGVGLEQWVRNGGHLVVSVQSNWQLVKQGPLSPMLPAVPNGTKRLNDLGSLESFAGSNAAIPSKDLTVAVLEGAKRAGILCETTSSPPTPIVVRGTYGFGRVTVVALDVDGKPFSDWKDKPLFWVKVLDLHGRGDKTGPPNNPGAPGAFYQNNATDLSSLLHRSLEQFSGVKLVPFGWVAFFVFIYILLIGPGDYFFLKKVVKRMELTWITFPLIVVLVSIAAYVAAYAVKGTDLRVNKVDVLDVDAKSGIMRGTTWSTIFSPQNRDYTVSVIPTPLDRDAKAEPPAKLSAGTQLLITWFGAADSRFVSGNANRLNLSGSGYNYDPLGQAEQLRNMRVPIWSTKSITARWLTPPTNPVVQSDLVPTNSNRVDGTITNLTKRTFRNAVLIVGKQVYDRLGDIAPGASVRIDNATRARPLPGYLEEHGKSFQQFLQTYNQYNNDEGAAAAMQRPDLLRTVMFFDASGNKAGILNTPLHDLDLSGQLALDRPMLLAEIDGPACALRLEGSSANTKFEQSTLLRVILPEPVAKEEAEKAQTAK